LTHRGSSGNISRIAARDSRTFRAGAVYFGATISGEPYGQTGAEACD
jgi:hypothetical protein